MDKRCRKCQRALPGTGEYFFRNKQYKDGLDSCCKDCLKAQHKQYALARTYEPVAGFTKSCISCEKSYPATKEYFHITRRNKDCLASHCKFCCKAKYQQNRDARLMKGRLHYQLHRDQINAARRVRYTKEPELIKEGVRSHYWANRDKKLQYGKAYRKANLERCRRKAREYHRWLRANKKEVCLERASRYRKENRKKLRAAGMIYYWENRERELARTSAWVKTEHGRSLNRVKRQRRRALETRAKGSFGREDVARKLSSQKGLCWWCNKSVNDGYHIDHLIPLARGGNNLAKNIVISCPSCNLSKSDKMPSQFCGRLL